MPALSDITGVRYTHVLVLARGGRVSSGDWAWKCQCDACGKIFHARGRDLRRGDYISCGCVGRARSKERARNFKLRHGAHGTPLYKKWMQMHSRCNNDSDYTSRGITVCSRWQRYEAFAQDMAATWKPGLSLERKNPHKGYTPSNCTWIPVAQQSGNRTNCIKVLYENREQYLWEVAKSLGMRRSTLWMRYKRGHRPPELFKPLRKEVP